jgi:FSR family fosmidomycin resistance protein-like MFS transporter
LTLLQLTDLLGDVFLGFAALYLVDVGASPQLAVVGVGILIAASLLGDAFLLPVLERVDSLRYLRWSASAALVAYPAFLLVGSFPAKLLLLLVPIGIVRAGWYSIPQAHVYSELPARGGIAVAIGAPADLIGSLLPLAIGVGAQRFGSGAAMWLLLAGPLAVLTLLPTSHPRDA